VKSIHHSNEYEIVFEDRKDFLVKWGPTTKDTVNVGPEAQEWFRYMPDGEKVAIKKADSAIANGAQKHD
jgi:hypothetical protein